EQLLDALVEISKPSLGIHPTALCVGFLATDTNPAFEAGIFGSEQPQAVPEERELVCRGMGAMPALLAHLDDNRNTRLTVKPFAGVASDGTEYSPRDSKKMPPDVRCWGSGEFNRIVNNYTVKIGDVCFVLVGQIVNRRLLAVRYQPSGCLIINSPVETPALAA